MTPTSFLFVHLPPLQRLASHELKITEVMENCFQNYGAKAVTYLAHALMNVCSRTVTCYDVRSLYGHELKQVPGLQPPRLAVLGPVSHEEVNLTSGVSGLEEGCIPSGMLAVDCDTLRQKCLLGHT